MSASTEGRAAPTPNPDRVLVWLLVVLVALRVAYHATYLGEVPFALATISDGAVYEQAARDIVEHPPWGTEAFYLQGSYAYLLAIGMAFRTWATLGLLVQLGLAALALFVANRAFVRLWGQRAGRVCTLLLLAEPALAFYENKFVSASLGVSSNVLVLAAFVAWLAARKREAWRATWVIAGLLGLASGLALLARPNLVLALPFTLVALLVAIPEQRLRRATPSVLSFALGCLLALAPMALRNYRVTGYPDLQPIHGGGTSFYIGNNPKAQGLWNDAGMLSARLGTESLELAEQLDVDPSLAERERARAIGDELYRRAFEWIREHPGEWLALELRKLWLTLGNQQLTQDYDWLGERELIWWAHRLALPFSLLLGLALLGGVALARGWQPERIAGEGVRAGSAFPDTPATRRALACFVAGQLGAVLAANLLYFTSAQHRLPLVIPLVLLAGPGLLVAIAEVRARLARQPAPLRIGWLAWSLVGLAIVQGFVPRLDREHPHAVHYYNLAMAQDTIGEPRDALHSLDRAIELRPDQPLFHLRRAHLRFRLADLDGAQSDVEIVLAHAESLPKWMLDQARLEQASIDYERRHGTRHSNSRLKPRPRGSPSAHARE